MRRTFSPEAHAEAFLKLLDPSAGTFAFRVFSETSGSTIAACNRNGQIGQLRPFLQQKNEGGGGVFVVVNKGGQRSGEISRVRAVFADTDGAPLGPIKAALTPHIIVESSPDRWHAYWLVEPSFPLDKFSAVQTAIAEKFGTDPSIKDLPRVMRVPGFYHNKRKPYLCSLVALDRERPRYSIDDIVNGLCLDLNSAVKFERASRANVGSGQAANLEEVERALAYLNPFVPREEWLGHILALAHEFGEGGRDLAHRWSRGDLSAGGPDVHA
jgi:hypothetical protein